MAMQINWYRRAQLAESGNPIAVDIIAGLTAIATNSGPVDQFLEHIPVGQADQVHAAIEEAKVAFLNANALGQTELSPEQWSFLEEVGMRGGGGGLEGGLDNGSQTAHEPLAQVPSPPQEGIAI